jgi:hypothetical protein
MYTSKLTHWFRENRMSRLLKLLMVVAMVLTIFGAHGTASAGGGGDFHFDGESATAMFFSVDESGCIVTDVYLWSSDAVVSSSPGQRNPVSAAYVALVRFDQCNGTELLRADGWTELPEADFQVVKRYQSATLHTPITVQEYESGNSFEMQLDLTWTADGDLSHQGSHNIYRTPGCLFNFHTNGILRHAQVSGTVSDGITNYTPEPASYAEIGSLRSGSVQIGCD